ncbi:MAG: cell wall hydrolase [Victivallales bacterium]|jgi:hypothetical protein
MPSRKMKTSDLKKLLYSTFGDLRDDQLLGLVDYGESRGEPREGQIAVGTVILERVDHRDWDGKTIKEVCLLPYQFSCLLPDDPNFKQLALIASGFEAALMKSSVLTGCHEIAKGLLDGTIPRNPLLAEHHCMQYKVVGCKAAWADKMRLILIIGHHEFYV